MKIIDKLKYFLIKRKERSRLYIVKKIGAGSSCSSTLIVNLKSKVKLEVFYDIRLKNSTNFRIKENECYALKLKLHGDVVEENQSIKFGKKIPFVIKKKERIGGWRYFFSIETELGEFYILVDEASNRIFQDNKKGWYNYRRIDVIQVNDNIHFFYK